MGTDTFYRYLTSFGLGKSTGLDLPGESEGILIGSRYVKNVDLARIGFGQSVAVTPLQLMMAANACINGGKLMKPYLVSEIQSAEGEVLQRATPMVRATPIRAETSDTMRELLEAVVKQGGGKNASSPRLPYRRQDRHGAGVQGGQDRPQCTHRLLLWFCAGGGSAVFRHGCGQGSANAGRLRQHDRRTLRGADHGLGAAIP